ncbi:MAG: hypothetical protein LC687_00775 [Actinobacteria bacterium]|nr:hypothetical protein [Actinomycetota bacterium]
MTVERMIEIFEDKTNIELYNSEYDELREAFEEILRTIEKEGETNE